ncbi:hypothetical protein ONZ45_g93 [Pleurotus djamor]|nr:hypothetical protein ONZ45_g93 [Pleurotus djamor]
MDKRSGKRRRIDSVPSSDHLPNTSTPPYAFDNTADDRFRVIQVGEEPVEGGTSRNVYSELEASTHEVRLSLQEDMARGKGTEIAYPRQLKEYEKFWLNDALIRRANDPACEIIEAHPITATKVAKFLEHETTRPRKRAARAENSTTDGGKLGWESIKQITSALEHHRKNHQHLEIYRSCPEAQLPLRNDSRIQTLEKSAKTTETQKLADSYRIKAFGAPTDTYTDDELTRASMYFLRNAVAYRGDNTRRLMWSDLRLRSVPLQDISPTAKETALILLSNQGKSNSSGRLDEQGALRHRNPELCLFGALGFYFFSLFHIQRSSTSESPTDFTSGDSSVDSGRRDWYRIRLFPGAHGNESEMTYENHRKRVNIMKTELNIAISKVTHAGRPYTAITAREHGASRDDTKDLGGWSQPGSYHVYDQTLPVDAMIGAASFNARKQETYMVARGVLDPPSDMVNLLFPWVESELENLHRRRHQHGKSAEDVALKHFLEFLIHSRRVILQDAAALYPCYPECPLFTFPPFNSVQFRTFAAESVQTIRDAEEQSRLQLQHFPKHVVASMHGVLTQANIHHQGTINHLLINQQHMRDQLESFIQHHTLPQTSSRRVKPSRRSNINVTPETTCSPRPASSSSNPSNTLPPASFLPLDTVSAASIPIPPLPLISALPSQLQTVSRRGTIYPSVVFPLSIDAFEREQQLDSLDQLESKLPIDRLRRHVFQWVRKPKHSEWLPEYKWWTPDKPNTSPTIRNIWTEYKDGMDGQLSIRQLNSVWMARWKGNEGKMKAQGSRRQKVINLIETLVAKNGWEAEHALAFLEDRYPIPTPATDYLKTTRAFIDALQKTGGTLYQDIITASNPNQTTTVSNSNQT